MADKEETETMEVELPIEDPNTSKSDTSDTGDTSFVSAQSEVDSEEVLADPAARAAKEAAAAKKAFRY